jgi:peptidoglycan/LPS O-acetylase OafA/YrhL
MRVRQRGPGLSLRHDESTSTPATQARGSEAATALPGPRSAIRQSPAAAAAHVTDSTTQAAVAPAPSTRGRRGHRLYALDVLRFVAAFSVVIYHYTARGRGWHTPVRQLFPLVHVASQYGWLGVELFFLISGFVICMSSWDRRVGAFFASRVARLFPAYLVAVAFTASIVAIWPGFSLDTNKDNVLLNFTMLEIPLHGRPVDSVYWTLLSELLFYLLFALVVWRGLTYQRAVAFCVLWTIASVIVPEFANTFAGDVLQPEYSPYFIAGIAFYLMYRFGPNLLLACIVLVSYILATHQIKTDVQTQATLAGNHLSLAVVYAVLAACFALIGLVALGRLSWVRGKWTIVLGTVTYPLYLIHQAVGFTVISRLDRHLNRYVLLTGLILVMIGTAWLIYRTVEKTLAPKVRRALMASLHVPAGL